MEVLIGKIIYDWAIFHTELLNNQRVILIMMIHTNIQKASSTQEAPERPHQSVPASHPPTSVALPTFVAPAGAAANQPVPWT